MAKRKTKSRKDEVLSEMTRISEVLRRVEQFRNKKFVQYRELSDELVEIYKKENENENKRK